MRTGYEMRACEAANATGARLANSNLVLSLATETASSLILTCTFTLAAAAGRNGKQP